VHNTKITTNSPMIANSPIRSTARFSQSNCINIQCRRYFAYSITDIYYL